MRKWITDYPKQEELVWIVTADVQAMQEELVLIAIASMATKAVEIIVTVPVHDFSRNIQIKMNGS